MKKILIMMIILCTVVGYGNNILTPDMKIAFTNEMTNADTPQSKMEILKDYIDKISITESPAAANSLYYAAMRFIDIGMVCEDAYKRGVLEINSEILARLKTRIMLYYMRTADLPEDGYEKEFLRVAQMHPQNTLIWHQLMCAYLNKMKCNEALEIAIGHYQKSYRGIFVDYFKSPIFQKNIKSYLIRNNMAVVGDKGRQNIENIYNEIFDTFDKPMWGGIEDVLRKIGLDVAKMDREKASIEYERLFNNILDMEISPNKVYDVMEFYKGRDEWVKFLKIYNGE